MQLIRFGKGVTVNIESVDSIMTVNLNVKPKYAVEFSNTDTEYKFQSTYKYPFHINVFIYDKIITVYRTSSSEEMFEMYEKILEYIADGVRSGSTIIDISEILKNSQPEDYDTDDEDCDVNWDGDDGK